MKTRMILMFLFCVVLLSNKSFADEIYLITGERIKGKIVKDGEFFVTVDVDDELFRYDRDQIERIDKDEEIKDYNDPDLIKNKKDLIRELMRVNSTRKNMEKQAEQVIKNVPKDKRAIIKSLLNIDNLIDELVPVYERYYSTEEIRQLIKFYASPLGKKVLETTPEMMKEILETSIEYFKEKLKDYK